MSRTLKKPESPAIAAAAAEDNKRRLRAASELKGLVPLQPKVSADVRARPFIPLGSSKPNDRNAFEIRKVIDKYVKGDDSIRQQMLVNNIIESVEEEGELIPVSEKILDDQGKVKSYVKWTPEDNRPPIVKEYRARKDGTKYKGANRPIRPWWACNIWGITNDNNGLPILMLVQASGAGIEKLDLGKIPWYKPCEINVTEDWRLPLAGANQDFIRVMNDQDAIAFVGLTADNFSPVDIKELITGIKEETGKRLRDGTKGIRSDLPVWTTIKDAQMIDWDDFYCSDVHIYTRQFDTGQACDVIDVSIDPTQPITCRFYSQHVAEQLADGKGGAYALLFYKPMTRTYQGKEQFSLDIFGALVYDYDAAAPPEEAP